MALDFTSEKYDKFMKIVENIIAQTKDLCLNLIGDNEKGSQAVQNGYDFISKKLKVINTLRKLKSYVKSNPFYVEPEELAIGLKWKKPKINTDTNIPNHKLSRSTFQYVSIHKTLKAIFSDESFQNYYIKYNTEEKHVCANGIYRDFCCGSTCQSNEIFDDRLALHLQLGIDDFEICCPLKSKAGIHKICATYFQILNVPLEYRSKLNNMFLVALCTSAYLKPDNRGYNYVAERIVKEIGIIETEGIIIGDRYVRGSLINIAGDNLGINGVFGFTECFVANYFCRICECHKKECQSMTKADKRKYRTKESYEKNLKIAENKNIKLDLTATKGVRRKCEFNNLMFFDVIQNVSVDIMHDINEGVIAYCLQDFFSLIIEKKIITAEKIQTRTRDFNYSESYKKNKPSLINFDKHNLNQNASQLYCLFLHLPFILFEFKELLEEYYTPAMYLQKCIQIIYSKEITEHDVKNLAILIDHHLSAVIRTFKRTLTPKHHFFLHYPDIIRKMGPVIHLWSMRLEAKHKFFTETARKKKNFINPTKTMASYHQNIICMPPDINTEIEPSSTSSQFINTMQFKKYEQVIKNSLGDVVDSIRVHKFATYNNIIYREGSLIIFNKKINEIVHILSKESRIFFVCVPQKVMKSDDFCNSLVVENEIDNSFIIDFLTLEDKQIYEKLYVDHCFHVIASTLALDQIR